MRTCTICGIEKEDRFFYFDGKDERKKECIKCTLKERRKKREETAKDQRRDQSGKNIELILYKRNSQTKGEKIIYKESSKVKFLQYSQMMYNHVKAEYGISAEDLNMMLLMYPIQPFTQKDVVSCKKLNQYKDPSFFNRMIDDGWIYNWKKNLYEYTDKGKKLMSDCHDWAIGKKLIPDDITEDVMDIIRTIQRKTRAALES